MKQILEIIVVAKDWEEAKILLAQVGIDEKSKINYREVVGMYVVNVTRDTPMTDEEYEAIKKHAKIAIHTDTESRKRVTEILDKIYAVETKLRILLLHISDIVSSYFEIFPSNNGHVRDYVNQKSLTVASSLNPITSHLTLGQMHDVLGRELSLKDKPLSADILTELINQSRDFESFKEVLKKEATSRFVWDEISEALLAKSNIWRNISKDIKKLKEFRDASAHYQVITNQARDELIGIADDLLQKLELKPKSSIGESSNSILAELTRIVQKQNEEFLEKIKTINNIAAASQTQYIAAPPALQEFIQAYPAAFSNRFPDLVGAPLTIERATEMLSRIQAENKMKNIPDHPDNNYRP